MSSEAEPGRRAPAEQRLDAIVWPALRRMGISRKVRDAQLDDVLAVVVGPHAAPLCRPAGLDRGVLTIATAHGALAHQLQLESPRLIASLNEHLGGEVVKRLRFRALDGGPTGGTR
ncbi:MAG TPA: DUF721 domain-containing protein [Candidatus Dormibacteraeota bacterium]|jgi:hypothetical protein|nr:DUF721 domain-containing protein [Candidatus Dormibacteraeota bacterium]